MNALGLMLFGRSFEVPIALPDYRGYISDGMMTSDGREIVFAGAGVLWGATTFVRGLHAPKAHRSSTHRSSLIVGLVLTVACTGYLALSLLDLKH